MSAQFVGIDGILAKRNNVFQIFRKISCKHQSLVFLMENFTFRCKKYNKQLIKLSGENEFRLFCSLSGIDPEKLIL